MKFWTILLAATLALGALDAEAARMARSGSVGRQSSNVTQRYGNPSAAPSVAPRSPAVQPAPTAPTTTPAAAPRRNWGGMLGGLAAGLGLAWLAHSLGFGAGFGNILLLLLVALVAMAVFRAMRSRRPASGYAYPGATVDEPVSPRQYNPEKVGNDASARPWERNTTAFEAGAPAAGSGIRIGSGLEPAHDGLAGPQTWGVPQGFDTAGFLAAAKRNFVTLQDAWDRGDVGTLRSMMTDEMLGEIRRQIGERGAPDRTEVVMLEAQLLGIEEVASEYLASVEFSGMIREDLSAGPAPFREVWNMVKPKDGSAGWLVAGVQALQ